MDTNDILELLINKGCSSIAYRVRKEIKQEDISQKEYIHYQNLIFTEPKVQKILSWQNADGYFGSRLHTAPSRSKVWTHEGCVRYLLEMGLENEHVNKSLDAMLQLGWAKECENSRAASVFGYEMIRASLFAQAGRQDYDFVTEWVNHALQGFQNIADTEKYMDLVYQRNDYKLVFNEGKYLPVIYHLRLLAFTDYWRTKENMEMMKTAYDKLYQWLPFPPIYLKGKTYPVTPLGTVCWSVNDKYDEDLGFFWIHFYEMSARMGMLGKESPFRSHYEIFKEDILMQKESIIGNAKKKKDMYVGWSGYSGIALEGDWKTKQQIMSDFIFRILLIDKYNN